MSKPKRRKTKRYVFRNPVRRAHRLPSQPPTEAKRKKLIDEELHPSFRVTCYYRGLDKKTDAAIEKLAGRRCVDSGMSMYLELRDMNFRCKSYKQASAVAVKIAQAKLPGVRVMISGSWEISHR